MSFPIMPNISGQRGLDSLSLIASASSTTATLTVPATARTGDLLILFDCPAFTATTGISGPVPSGFTNLGAGPTGGWNNGIIQSAAICTPSMPGSVLTGANGTDTNAKVLVVIRGNAPIQTFSALNINTSSTNLDPPGITVVGTSVVAPAVLACCGSSLTNVSNSWQGYPSTFTTPAFGTVLNPVNRIVTGFSLIVPPAASYTQTIDLQDYGTGNMMRGCWINLT